ncbi:hypothetical protein ACQPZP_03005 [Spirillospora sp. CA-142024]|uniref:hypothetical protein n=1 Tax=Spirillospora sp. CA-142024 TaxID=3240036 RepID=UPI003D8F45F7
MASRRKRRQRELAAQKERLASMRNQAENYIVLAAMTSDPDVREGAEQLARFKNKEAAGRPIWETLSDPDGKPTPKTRKAREAYRKHFPDD